MIKKILFYSGISIIILWLTGLIWFCWQINHFDSSDNQKTDAIIALTGGRNRITEAVELLVQGKADRLFISGVAKDISLQNIQNTQHLTIPEHLSVEIGHNAANTIENAKETNDWVKQHHIKSIRLVTSNYHVLRSLLEFHQQNPQLKIIAHPVYSEKIEKKWWTSWRTFSLIFKEYNKFLYAYIRTQIDL